MAFDEHFGEITARWRARLVDGASQQHGQGQGKGRSGAKGRDDDGGAGGAGMGGCVIRSFTFDGDELGAKDTPEDLDMEDDDIVEAYT